MKLALITRRWPPALDFTKIGTVVQVTLFSIALGLQIYLRMNAKKFNWWDMGLATCVMGQILTSLYISLKSWQTHLWYQSKPTFVNF